jgi:hypothetical protein
MTHDWSDENMTRNFFGEPTSWYCKKCGAIYSMSLIMQDHPSPDTLITSNHDYRISPGVKLSCSEYVIFRVHGE